MSKSLSYWCSVKLPQQMIHDINAMPWDEKFQLGAAITQMALDEYHQGLIDMPLAIEVTGQVFDGLEVIAIEDVESCETA